MFTNAPMTNATPVAPFLNTPSRLPYRGVSQPSGIRPVFDLADHIVEVSSPDVVTRRTVISDGMAAEIVQATSHNRFEFHFRAPVHLLVVYENGARRNGETFVEGLSHSTLRDFSRKLTFVPASREYHEWQEPRTLARLMYVYFDPAKLRQRLDAATEADVAGLAFAARLFFEDATLLDTALKLKGSLEGTACEDRQYLEALGVVLVHELIRAHRGTRRSGPQIRGGLAAWQQRVVSAHIEAHLDEPIALATLAELARLSACHFCRAFKQSFGAPPHRYHTHRRIERAKAMLATRAHSVTEIGLTLGYSETSSFTTAFRKSTGLTPTAYQRGLG